MLRFYAFWILLISISFRATPGADVEAEAFKSAVDAFKDKFYERAEEQFSGFVTKFPSSTNAALAVLYQAQSRHFQKKHDAAIELLQGKLPQAGAIADQYVLTWADSVSTKGDLVAAGALYERLLKEFPQSPLRLQAAYLQALTLYQQKNFAGTIDLLENKEKVFRNLADAAPQDRFSYAGGVLLADAMLAIGQVNEARDVAVRLPVIPDRPEWQWEKYDLLARAEISATNLQAALPHLTNAVAAAQQAQRPRLQAQSWNLEADLYRRIGQPANAISAYERITSLEALPVEQRRLAVLKTVELHSFGGEITNAIRRLESYLGIVTNEPAADLLKVKAGELWIDQARADMRSAKAGGPAHAFVTNDLAQARTHLNNVISQHANSTHAGRAWLNLGWSFWEEGMFMNQPARLQEAEAAFRTASEKLTRSDDQALALFKLADTQFYLGRPGIAITNYQTVLKNYADLSQVKNALFDKTYAQLVRASAESGQLDPAAGFLETLRKEFPNSPLTEESIFLFGNALAASGSQLKARTIFQEFLTQYPTSGLTPDVRFAEARTYGAEGDFPNALEKHDQWLGVYTNHLLRAEVEFRKGVLLDRAGQATNALTVFTNFVAQFPTSALGPAAQTWVADYYYGKEQWLAAEQNYQRVFQTTNWSSIPLAYQARMMAARTAFRRQGYEDARSYLETLINDPSCPVDLKPEALFALGDIFLEEPIVGSTNAVNNFTQAAGVFDRIATQYPSNRIAILAIAKKGDCYFQIGSHTNYLDSYVLASNAYTRVLESAAEGTPVKVRNQAEFGLARVLERMGDDKPETERVRLQKEALNHFLNIVYNSNPKGTTVDPLYRKLAAREAGRIAEELGDPDAAIQLYRRMVTESPASKALWESRISLLESARGQKTSLQ